MSKTSIQWTGETWNPLAGCTEVSPGCTNCYAAVMAHRLAAMGQRKYSGTTRKTASGKVRWTGKLNLDHDAMSIPLKKKKPTVYFVNSMSDLFHEDVPDGFIDQVFAAMALCPQHTFQVLTKRAERMQKYFETYRKGNLGYAGHTFKDLPDGGTLICPLPNLHLGVSCEDQQRADERIPHLLRTPAAVTFLSCEPLLGPIDYLASWLVGCDDRHLRPRSETERLAKRDKYLRSIDWVIIGGESGPGARPCQVDWIRSLVKQCNAAGVPVFVKQMGSHVIDHDTTSAEHFPERMCWPDGTRTDGHRVQLKDNKGGVPEEWPIDIRVRQMPAMAARLQ